MSAHAEAFSATMPAAHEAERSLLGKVLLDGEVWGQISAVLTAEDFDDGRNARIFCAMADVIAAGQKIDQATVMEWMSRHKTLEASGGAAYLWDMADRLNTIYPPKHYMAIVKDRAKVRAAIRLAERAQLAGMESSITGDELISKIIQDAVAVEAQTAEKETTIADDVMTTLHEMNVEAESKRELLGLTLCIPDLDSSIMGLRRHEIMVIGAMPERGKTAYAMQICRENAKRGDRVDFFSLEMGKSELMRRNLASVSGVHPMKLRDPRYRTPEDKLAIEEAGALISQWPMQIHKPKGLTPAKLYSKMRLMVERHKRQLMADEREHLIVVDHLKAFSFCCPGGDERHRMNFAIETLRRFADEEPVAMIVLHHFARPQGGDINKMPTMISFKESGDVEAAANVALGLHREEGSDGAFTGNDNILVMKMRAGEKGPIAAMFDKKRLEYVPDYRPRG
jgi:replicative DNA helicase